MSGPTVTATGSGSCGGFATSITIPYADGVAATGGFLLYFGSSQGSGFGASVTDTAGNSYVQEGQWYVEGPPGGGGGCMFWCASPAAIAPGGSLTISGFGGVDAGCGAVSCVVAGVLGTINPNTQGTGFGGTSPSMSTGNLPYAPIVVFGTVTTYPFAPSISIAPGWSGAVTSNGVQGTNSLQWKITNSPAPMTFNPPIGAVLDNEEAGAINTMWFATAPPGIGAWGGVKWF